MEATTADQAEAFRRKYGPWAVIAGASEGMGAEYARLLARRGVGSVLVARNAQALEALASELEQEFGVQTRVVVLDLSDPEAMSKLAAGTADLDVGFYISNAGADTNGARFLDVPLETWSKLVQRNTIALMAACHHYGAAMKARGRGGMILMSSGAGLGGGPRVAIYSATKAFELSFGESLWAELAPNGVDVLSVVTPPTDTPAMQRLLGKKGLQVPGMYAPADIARSALAALPHGPTLVFPFAGMTAEDATTLARQRRERVEVATQGAAAFFGD